MSMRRMVFGLGLALGTMLAVVIVRAETTRVHAELSGLDRRAEVLWQELRERELDLARLRSPALIRARVAEMRLQAGPADGDVRGVAPADR